MFKINYGFLLTGTIIPAEHRNSDSLSSARYYNIIAKLSQSQPSWAVIALLSQLWGSALLPTPTHTHTQNSSLNLSVTCSWLVCDLFVTCLWLVYDEKLMSCSWFVHYVFMTCSLLIHNFFTTYSQFLQALLIEQGLTVCWFSVCPSVYPVWDNF